MVQLSHKWILYPDNNYISQWLLPGSNLVIQHNVPDPGRNWSHADSLVPAIGETALWAPSTGPNTYICNHNASMFSNRISRVSLLNNAPNNKPALTDMKNIQYQYMLGSHWYILWLHWYRYCPSTTTVPMPCHYPNQNWRINSKTPVDICQPNVRVFIDIDAA